jgi:hypothetical protein
VSQVADIFKRLRSPEIDSKESIPPVFVGRYDNPIPTRFLATIDCSKIPARKNRQARREEIEEILQKGDLSTYALSI